MATTRRIKPRSNLERYAFLFMRLSGVTLLLLAVGHMLLQHVFRDVHNLTLQVVADAWRSWGWLSAAATTSGRSATRGSEEQQMIRRTTVSLCTLAAAIPVVAASGDSRPIAASRAG